MVREREREVVQVEAAQLCVNFHIAIARAARRQASAVCTDWGEGGGRDTGRSVTHNGATSQWFEWLADLFSSSSALKGGWRRQPIGKGFTWGLWGSEWKVAEQRLRVRCVCVYSMWALLALSCSSSRDSAACQPACNTSLSTATNTVIFFLKKYNLDSLIFILPHWKNWWRIGYILSKTWRFFLLALFCFFGMHLGVEIRSRHTRLQLHWIEAFVKGNEAEIDILNVFYVLFLC